jgi:DNA-binding MarR family transcriptional regulator
MNEDLREITGCTCLRIRRAARRMTQVYDHLLAPAGLTVNQFGVLGQLFGADRMGSAGLSIGGLAERLGTDPTTLNRNLKPLATKGLVIHFADPADARRRIVRITDRGRRKLLYAVPLWRRAQAQVEEALGRKTMTALNELLDLTAERMAAPS